MSARTAALTVRVAMRQSAEKRAVAKPFRNREDVLPVQHARLQEMSFSHSVQNASRLA